MSEFAEYLQGAVAFVYESAAYLASLTEADFVVAYATFWFVIKFALITVAIIILLSGLEDLFLDVYYWVLMIARGGRDNGHGLPRDLDELKAIPQKRLAIIVPAWDESDVIARMISNTLNTLDYENYHIFAGNYPNDPDTAREIDRMAARYPNVHRAEVGHPGPTSKADCLNWIIQNILLYEQQTGDTFDGFVMQDAEDVVHPMALRVMNGALLSKDFVQLPVLSMNRDPFDMVACTYMDEFSEWHTKDLLVREHMTGIVPSAGVASAFSRRAMLLLAKVRDNQPFNTDSLTEDYDIAMRLHEFDMPGAFVRYWARMPYETKTFFLRRKRIRHRWELVCTREFFPNQVWTSIRQKSRWTLGISYQGWEQLGWRGRIQDYYFQYRDRKGIVTAPASIIGYAIVFQIVLYYWAVAYFPDIWHMAPLIETGSWVWYLIGVNLFFLLNRMFHRLFFVGRAHGLLYLPLSPLRAVLANWISFRAGTRAFWQYMKYRITGAPLTWDKTSHAYPSLTELQSGRRPKMGEVLVHWGALRTSEINAALKRQKEAYRPLGLLLLDDQIIDDESLARAFSEIEEKEYAFIDGLKLNPAARATVPQHLARKHLCVPYALSDNRLTLACAEPLRRKDQAEIEKALPRDIKLDFLFSPRSDIAFALNYGYQDAPLAREEQDMLALRRMQILSTDEISFIWREIRKRHVMLRDVVVRLGYVTHEQMQDALELLSEKADLEQVLLAERVLSDTQLADARSVMAEPPFDVISVAVELGYIKDPAVPALRREIQTLPERETV